MMNTSASISPQTAISTILRAGIIAGFLDILAAIIQFSLTTGRGPEPVFRFIASGVFGKEAFSGGAAMILWGFLLHMLIALFFATFFFLLCTKLSFLYRNPVAAGIGYGIFVWLVMNLIVLPFSNTPPFPFDAAKAMIAAAILVLFVGLPVALITSGFFRRSSHEK